MHGLNRPSSARSPPVAERRAEFSVHHGVELVDEYAWLRAANWQEVMRDPGRLDPEIRAYLEAENAYTEAALADTRDLQAALFAEMKARIKEDDSSVPAPDGALRVLHELRHRRPVPAPLPAPARRRPGGGPARRQQGGRGQGLLAARRRRAQPRPPAPGLRRRRQGLRAFHGAHPRPGHRPRPARGHPRHARLHRLGARQPDPVLRPPRRQPAPAVRLPAPPRHAGGGRTCWSTRKRTAASMSASTRPNRASSSSSTRTTTRPARST